jgi:hypothetical protein
VHRKRREHRDRKYKSQGLGLGRIFMCRLQESFFAASSLAN